jgi:PAS domain S-box-containing protein
MTDPDGRPVTERCAARAEALFAAHRAAVFRHTDRLFAALLAAQWLAGVAVALWVSPRAWVGAEGRVHAHVWAALLLGGATVSLPVALALGRPGSPGTRHALAVGQMIMGALLIHLTGGRIETHFHVFGSLAFLAFYRDWGVLVTASAVVAADHMLRGVYWPRSVFGVLVAEHWRWVEHAGWVAFTDAFLIPSCLRGAREMREIALRRAELEVARERVEAEVEERTAELRASQSRKGALLESALDAIIIMDHQGRVVEFNPAAEATFGWSHAEALGRPVAELIVPEAARAAHRAGLARFLADGHGPVIGRRVQMAAARRDGTEFPAELAVSVIRSEGPPMFAAYIRDVTERVRSESALRESEQRLQAVLDSAKAAAFLKDLEGRYVLVNREFATIFDSTPERVLGRTDHELFPGPMADAFRANDRTAIEAGRAIEVEEVALLPGGPRTYLSTKAPLYGADGAAYGTCGIATDITERKHAEEAIRDLNGRLEARLSRIAALRTIDTAITTGFDLRLTLEVCLDQAVSQLRVDAAAILLRDPHAHHLTYAAARGFRDAARRRDRLPPRRGPADRAVSRRAVVHIPDLAHEPDALAHSPAAADEGFVAYFAVPLMVKGEVKGVVEVFHRAPLDADPEWVDFLETLAGQAAIAVDNASMFDSLQRSNHELTLAYDATIEGWSRALDLRDKETEGHTRRVTELTLQLARAMGVGGPALVQIRRGALLHDIGKMGVPDAILLKPGPLAVEEWQVMRRHPAYALEMLAPIEFLGPALEIPYCHHEKWDGTGYPRGLKGEQIPLAARIFAAADIWDALRSDRPYRKGWPEARVRTHIASLAGTHLDPRVVEAFLNLPNDLLPSPQGADGPADTPEPAPAANGVGLPTAARP